MDLSAIFAPATLAIIGVSRSNDQHPANVIFNKNLLHYPAEVFAVNPRGGSLQGEKIYTSLAEIDQSVDLAVIAVRAEQVPDVIAQCLEHRVKGAIVISGGFAESGRHDLQEQLLRLTAGTTFPFIGPNCLGVYSPGRVDTFFLPGERMITPARGNVAIVSQSGGILVDLLVKFAGEGVGLSSAISIGNKALIKEEQLLRHLAADPATKVIAFYVEGFGPNEGRRFVQAAAECGKPVVVMKAGKTAGGSRAVSSHTASLAGDYKVFAEVLAQHDVVVAQNELELLSFCESLSYYRPRTISRLAIITGSGGHGAMAVDACAAQGLEVPAFSPEEQAILRAQLTENIRPIATLGNPIDLTGSALEQDFVTTATHLASLPGIDAVIILLLPYLPGISSDLGARLSQIRKRTGKPFIAYVPHVEKYRMLFEGFEINQVPASSSIEGAVLMAKALCRSI